MNKTDQTNPLDNLFAPNWGVNKDGDQHKPHIVKHEHKQPYQRKANKVSRKKIWKPKITTTILNKTKSNSMLKNESI